MLSRTASDSSRTQLPPYAPGFLGGFAEALGLLGSLRYPLVIRHVSALASNLLFLDECGTTPKLEKAAGRYPTPPFGAAAPLKTALWCGVTGGVYRMFLGGC